MAAYVYVVHRWVQFEGSEFVGVAKTITGAKKEADEFRKDRGHEPLKNWKKYTREYQCADPAKGEYGAWYVLERVQLFDLPAITW